MIGNRAGFGAGLLENACWTLLWSIFGPCMRGFEIGGCCLELVILIKLDFVVVDFQCWGLLVALGDKSGTEAGLLWIL